jgi:hypothetical protein
MTQHFPESFHGVGGFIKPRRESMAEVAVGPLLKAALYLEDDSRARPGTDSCDAVSRSQRDLRNALWYGHG